MMRKKKKKKKQEERKCVYSCVHSFRVERSMLRVESVEWKY